MVPGTSWITAPSIRSDTARTYAATLLPVVGMGAATYSVVRFRVWIVLGYLLLAALLGALVVSRRRWPVITRNAPALGLIAVAVFTWVPTWTYMSSAELTLARRLFSGAALICAVLIVVAGRGALTRRTAARIVLAVAISAQLGVSLLVIRQDPAPSIDVWYTLQGAADAFADGRSWYRETWVAPPGVMGAFTYLPWTVVLLAPFRWFFGDVRWGIAAAGVIAAMAIAWLPIARRATTQALADTDRSPHAASRDEIRLVTAGYAAMVLLLPGTTTQLEQAWTEPLLLACLATAVWCWLDRRPVIAALCLAIGLASKQHLALLLPLLAAWPMIGWRRTLRLGLLTALLVLPWLLTDLNAMVADTLTLLVRFPPMRFANSLYILVLNQTGLLVPFWVTGAVLLMTLVGLCWIVHRRAQSLSRMIGACALLLLVANVMNKQAFYNQYWLVASMVLLALAVQATEEAGDSLRIATSDDLTIASRR